MGRERHSDAAREFWGMTAAVSTVYDQVRHWAVHAGQRIAVSVWRNGVATDLSYSTLFDLAALSAAAIRNAGVRPGDRVLLVLPNDESFVVALLGCAAAGGIAVPAPLPTGRRPDAFQARIRGIVADCSPSLVFTLAEWTAELAALLPAGSGQTVLAWESVRRLTATATPAGSATHPASSACVAVAAVEPVGTAHEPCLLQYTSGSTGRPKGVAVTHQMLAAHCAQASKVYGEQVDDIAVSWVPLFHDMGLITGLIRPLYSGYRTVLLRPEEFVAAPDTWLQAVHASRGTLSSAPNFAYDLCVRRIDETRVAELDLSCWRVARNAGEVIRPETADRFVRHFAAAGFRADSFCPSYGLAEATLTVTACTPATPAIRVAVRQADLDRGSVKPRVLAGGPGDQGEAAGSGPERLLLSSGVPLPDTQVRVGKGRPGEVGDIVVTGPAVSPGYWPQSPDSRAPRTVATGDIGFSHDGHLFVLGRRDDTLIVNGRNYFLSDLAAACAAIEGIRPGRVAAFLAPGPGHDAEVVWLIAETRSDTQVTAQRRRQLQRQIQRQVLDLTELFVAQVALLRPGGMPVTTSGKVRVSQIRQQLEDGSLALLSAAQTADVPSSDEP